MPPFSVAQRITSQSTRTRYARRLFQSLGVTESMTGSKESTSSKIAVRVIAGVLIAGALWLISRIPNLLHWLSKIVLSFIAHLKGTSEFPNWSLYLLALMSIHTLINLAALLIKPKGLNVTAYNQDIFLGVKWRWSYISGHPSNAWAFCPYPGCDTVLVYHETIDRYEGTTKTSLTCETCKEIKLIHDGDKEYLVAKIHRQIDRVIRTGGWIEKVQKNYPTTG